MKKIVLTGGGTAGHVTPNIALMPTLLEAGFEISYIGSYNGMERGLIEAEGIPYYGIDSGKLRRYFDPKNFTDPFRVVHGFFEAKRLLKKLAPDVVFSKGGFVSAPVVLAAGTLHIPAVLHESDMTPGLANRIAMRGADKICCNFPETINSLPENKGIVTGTPIRGKLFAGDKQRGLSICGFDGVKPVLMIIGGSQGSVFVNRVVREALPRLNEDFDVIHLCGKGNLDKSLQNRKEYPGYVQFEYISEELPDLFAACDIAISRAGANAICELVALKKPNILIPLSLGASRGDQILNAKSFEKQGFSVVLEEDGITPEKLYDAVKATYIDRDRYIATMDKSPTTDASRSILSIVLELVK